MICNRFTDYIILVILACCILFGTCQNQPFQQGEWLYQQNCSSCHMADGSGLRGLYPPIKDSDYIRNNSEYLPCIIRYGIEDSIQVNQVWYDQPMEGISHLSVPEICNIINYMRNEWDLQIPIASYDAVEMTIKNCQSD